MNIFTKIPNKIRNSGEDMKWIKATKLPKEDCVCLCITRLNNHANMVFPPNYELLKFKKTFGDPNNPWRVSNRKVEWYIRVPLPPEGLLLGCSIDINKVR